MERDRGSRGSQGQGKRKETWMPARVTQAGVARGEQEKGLSQGTREGWGVGDEDTGPGAGWTSQRATATALDRPGSLRSKPCYLQTFVILLPFSPNRPLPSGQSFSSGLWERQGAQGCAGSKPSQSDGAICGGSHTATQPSSQSGRDQRRGPFSWMGLAILTPAWRQDFQGLIDSRLPSPPGELRQSPVPVPSEVLECITWSVHYL